MAVATIETMRLCVPLFLSLLALTIACGKERPELGRALAGAEIRELFAEKTVEGHHEIHGYDFESYYEATGTYRSHQSDKSAPRSAKWWVQGDEICVSWEDTPEDLCRRMFVDDRGVYRKVKVSGDERTVVVTFKSFTPGNVHHL
jgi:hypothetical protein